MRAVCRVSQAIIVLVPTLHQLPVQKEHFPQLVHLLVPLAQQGYIHSWPPRVVLRALPVDFACRPPHHLWVLVPALRDRFRLWAVAQLQLARPALQEGTAFSAAQAPLATGRVLLARIPSKEQVSSQVAFLVPRGDIALPALRRCQDQVFVRLGRTLSWALV